MKKRLLSMFLAVAVIVTAFHIRPVTVSSVEYELKLVWEPNLIGATSSGTGRNYIYDSDGNALGLITSSSNTNQLSVAADGVLKYTNVHTNHMRLNIIVAGTGEGGASSMEAGFKPTEGRRYRLEFDAQNSSKSGAAAIRYRLHGDDTSAASPVSGVTFRRDFFYPDDVSEKDKTHGDVAIGIINYINQGSTAYFSNIKIFEYVPIPCEKCGKAPCECPCDKCGKFPCECPCPECGVECVCVANWIFKPENYPDIPAYDPKVPSSATEGIKFIPSFGGLSAATLVRNHDTRYPSGSNKSGDEFDNTQILKHMDLSQDGWLRTGGWSTAENYVYLALNTSGYKNLVLKYDIRATSTSTPSSLQLQYSFDKKYWFNITDAVVNTRPSDWSSSNNTIISREEHLPKSTYNNSEVYIRWSGVASNTSGRIEFRNIILKQDENANPAKEEERFFTHINITIGATPESLGFSWFTPKGYTDKAYLQLVKASELADGEMPDNPAQYTAVNAVGSSIFDTNKVSVSGLEKSTTYAYRVGNGTEWSQIYTFKTQNPDSDYSVMIVADPQIGSSSLSSAANWRRTMKDAMTENPDFAFLINAGDHTVNGNDHTQFAGYVSPAELRNIPVAAVYGNHDHQMTSSYESVKYVQLLNQWPETVRAVTGDGKNGHDYYFSYGNTLYIMLDANIKDVGEYSQHEKTMRDAVDSHPDATWRVCVFHHDIYGGGDHAGTKYGDARNMQNNWSPFLNRWNIDMVFNGHDHVYARSKLIKGYREYQNNQTPAVFLQDINTKNPGVFVNPTGTQYIGLSSPNVQFYNLDTATEGWRAYGEPMSGSPDYTKMRVEGESLIVETYRYVSESNYRLVDSITFRKKALRRDLETMLSGAKLVRENNNTGWNAFQTALDNAKAVADNPSAAPQQIHNAFAAVYGAFYGLGGTVLICGKNGYVCNQSYCDLCNPSALTVEIVADGVKIHNGTGETVSTRGMFLSDDENELFRWQLPVFVIRPDEYVIIGRLEDIYGEFCKRARVEFGDLSVSVMFLSDAFGKLTNN